MFQPILEWIVTAIMSMLPILEIRGSLPYALLAVHIPWYIAYPYCVIFNALASPIVYVILDTIHKKLYGAWAFYARLFDCYVQKTREKIEPKVAKWGFWGVVIFVGIPLPVTGAWTGTVGAWLLGLDRKKTILSVLLGVSIAGIIVSTVILLGKETLEFFIKEPLN